VHLGQEVEISLDAYPDEPIHTTVTAIDFASHTTSTGGNAYTVETELPTSADDRYRIGMNGDAEIILNAKKNVLTVPLSAIVDDTYVYVRGEKRFEKKKIRLGIQSDTDAEVKSGLRQGDAVAVNPSDVEKRQKIKRPQDATGFN
jgi:multidrug efflux pump subunit AcrA (membrane-fusion protein)